MIINNELKLEEVRYLEKLADEFGLSITPIRQAFLKLEISNLVYFKSNGCAYVKNIDEKAAEDIRDYRTLIAYYVLRYVAKKMTNDKIVEIANKLLLMGVGSRKIFNSARCRQLSSHNSYQIL